MKPTCRPLIIGKLQLPGQGPVGPPTLKFVKYNPTMPPLGYNPTMPPLGYNPTRPPYAYDRVHNTGFPGYNLSPGEEVAVDAAIGAGIGALVAYDQRKR